MLDMRLLSLPLLLLLLLFGAPCRGDAPRFGNQFQSHMVLQRDAITAVYGQLLSTSSAAARVEVIVTDEAGRSYTSAPAQLSTADNYCLRAAGTQACPSTGTEVCCVATTLVTTPNELKSHESRGSAPVSRGEQAG